MKFDFTNTSDSGFSIIPPAKYLVVTGEWWKRTHQVSGNTVIDIAATVKGGDYDGENTMHFRTITEKEGSKGAFLSMLRRLGIIRDGDRGAKGELHVELDFGGTDDRGRVEVKSVSVNGEARPVKGINAVAVIETYQKEGESTPGTSIKHFEPIKEGESPVLGETPSVASGALGQVW